MRLLVILAMLVPVCAAAQTQAQPLGPACTKPDQRLITAQGSSARFSGGGASRKYDEQVAAFNTCTQSRIGNADREAARVRDENKNLRDQVAQSASSRIRRIEQQIADASQALNAGTVPQKPTAAAPVDAFPDPECKAANASLLTLKRGADNHQRERQYEGQSKDYQSCMRGWIAQAKSVIFQIKTDAEAEIKSLTAGANLRIAEIAAATRDAAKEADAVQQEQDTAVANLRSALAASSAPTAAAPGGGAVTEMEKSPHSQDMPTGAGDPDAIACRTRQQLADSRLMGPQICKRNRVWAELFKAGKTISADGQSIVSSEKGMTFGPVIDKR